MKDYNDLTDEEKEALHNLLTDIGTWLDVLINDITEALQPIIDVFADIELKESEDSVSIVTLVENATINDELIK